MESIPGFTLVKRLAVEGPSEVWSALSDLTEQLVTLHFLRTSRPISEEDQGRFMRQASICARLRHPGIVRFLAQGLMHDILWFATELVNDPSLRQFVEQNGPLSVPDAIGVMIQAMDIVAYLHYEDIVHRSLQPDSFRIRKQAGTLTVQLADLGSAKCFQSPELQRITRTHEQGYAIHAFTAPEALVNYRHLDPRSDIYAIGAILYFLLSRCAPYEAPDEQKLVMAILNTDPTPLNDIKPSVPQAVRDVVERALAREPDARFSTAVEMRNALSKLIGAPARLEPSAETHAIHNKLDRLLIGQEDLKRGQGVIYRKLNAQQRQTVEDLLNALQSQRQNEIEADRELREILDGIRRSLIHLQSRQIPKLDTQLRKALDKVTEILNTNADLHTGLELTIPIIPLLLDYKISFDAGSELNLSKLWDKLVVRLRRRTKGQI